MKPILKNFKNELIKGIKNVSEKTNELTALGRLKIDILALNRDIDRSFVKIGKKVYHMVEISSIKEIESDKQLSNLIKKTKVLMKKLKDMEKRLENIRKEGGIGAD